MVVDSMGIIGTGGRFYNCRQSAKFRPWLWNHGGDDLQDAATPVQAMRLKPVRLVCSAQQWKAWNSILEFEILAVFVGYYIKLYVPNEFEFYVRCRKKKSLVGRRSTKSLDKRAIFM